MRSGCAEAGYGLAMVAGGVQDSQSQAREAEGSLERVY